MEYVSEFLYNSHVDVSWVQIPWAEKPPQGEYLQCALPVYLFHCEPVGVRLFSLCVKLSHSFPVDWFFDRFRYSNQTRVSLIF